jgi:hypothetical protein
MNYSFTLTPHNQPRVIEGISVTRTGRIGLTKYFITIHGIERGMRAYMYWDSTNKTIAVEFTRKADATAYPVIFTRQYGAFINASRFFRSHRLELMKYAGRYPYSKLDGEIVSLPDASASVFVVELKKPMNKSMGRLDSTSSQRATMSGAVDRTTRHTLALVSRVEANRRLGVLPPKKYAGNLNPLSSLAMIPS